MYKKNLILVPMLYLCFLRGADGQYIKTQQGIVFKKGTSIRLGNVKISNKKSGLAKFSNIYGVFNILATTGDTLEITSNGYQTNYTIVSDFKDQVLYLDPFVELSEVVIRENSLIEDLQEVQKGYRSKGVFYTGTPHYYYLILKPMTFIYENFKSEVINARKFKKYAKREINNYEVSKGFNDEIIKKYTTIKDDELLDFTLIYKPSIQQTKNWSDYDFIDYIKKSYLEFKKHDNKKNKLKP